MEVFHLHGLVHPVICPDCLFVGLAFGAMTVAATVVADPLFIAAIADIFVPAQGRCTALLQGIERTQGKTVGPALLNILQPKLTYDLGELKLRAHYYF
jgi:D-serine deaminase-like pyridoxal phosphate-dependent protein